MTATNQEIVFDLTIDQLYQIQKHAKTKEINGKSHIRNKEDRENNLKEDSIAGTIGGFLLSIYQTGSDQLFRIQQHYANQFHTDGGQDLPGCSIDAKSSIMRNKTLDRGDYHLLVSKNEWNPNTTYYLFLIDKVDPAWRQAKVYLMGWQLGSNLTLQHNGRFEGSYAIKARDLLPLPPIRWDYR